MAEDVKATKVGSARKNITRFVKEVRSELRKVIWPSREQLINNTITVLLFCVIIGAIIFLFDTGLTYLVANFLTKTAV